MAVIGSNFVFKKKFILAVIWRMDCRKIKVNPGMWPLLARRVTVIGQQVWDLVRRY